MGTGWTLRRLASISDSIENCSAEVTHAESDRQCAEAVGRVQFDIPLSPDEDDIAVTVDKTELLDDTTRTLRVGLVVKRSDATDTESGEDTESSQSLTTTAQADNQSNADQTPATRTDGQAQDEGRTATDTVDQSVDDASTDSDSTTDNSTDSSDQSAEEHGGDNNTTDRRAESLSGDSGLDSHDKTTNATGARETSVSGDDGTTSGNGPEESSEQSESKSNTPADHETESETDEHESGKYISSEQTPGETVNSGGQQASVSTESTGHDDSSTEEKSSEETDEDTQRDSETTETATEGDAPAYKDREQLQEAYEACDTFAEMQSYLGVDVTPQTVRRHMIRHDVHETESHDRSSGNATEHNLSRETLAEVYNECQTFAEMKSELGVDVTTEAIRQRMIKHGIHTPNDTSSDGPDNADPGNADSRADEEGTSAGGTTESKSDATEASQTETTSNSEKDKDASETTRASSEPSPELDDARSPSGRAEESSQSGEDRLTPLQDRSSDSDVSTFGATPASEGAETTEDQTSGGVTAETADGSDMEADSSVTADGLAVPAAVREQVNLPDGVDVRTVLQAAAGAHTVHQVSRELEADRETTVELLRQCRLLSAVQRRVDRRDPPSVEDLTQHVLHAFDAEADSSHALD